MANIPAPLGIGKVKLDSGVWLPGFICEASAIDEAKDLTVTGGRRKFINQQLIEDQ